MWSKLLNQSTQSLPEDPPPPMKEKFLVGKYGDEIQSLDDPDALNKAVGFAYVQGSLHVIEYHIQDHKILKQIAVPGGLHPRLAIDKYRRMSMELWRGLFRS